MHFLPTSFSSALTTHTFLFIRSNYADMYVLFRRKAINYVNVHPCRLNCLSLFPFNTLPMHFLRTSYPPCLQTKLRGHIYIVSNKVLIMSMFFLVDWNNSLRFLSMHCICVWSRRCDCLVTWFCKTRKQDSRAFVSWPIYAFSPSCIQSQITPTCMCCYAEMVLIL